MEDWDQLVESHVLRITPDHSARSLTVELRSSDRRCLYIIRADDVYDVLIDGIRLNNIVDEVVCHSKQMSDIDSLLKLKLLLTGEEGPYIAGEFPHVDSKVEEIKSGKLQLWEFRPVYGAFFLILAKSLYLAANPQPT